jgi:hypothetical protein
LGIRRQQLEGVKFGLIKLGLSGRFGDFILAARNG